MRLEERRLFSNRMLLQLILPLIAEQALTQLVGLADSIMVSSAGEAAVSGVSLVNEFSVIILYLFGGLATGGAVVTSQYLGARQNKKAVDSAGQMILMSIVASVLLMVVGLVFAKQLLMLFFGAVEPEIMEAAVTYFYWNALSFPVIAVFNAGAAIMRCVGNSKISMKVSILKNAINIIGNVICIYGFKMGVVGVALPTVISRVIGAVAIMIPVFRQDHALRMQMRDLKQIRTDMMRKIARVSIPTALENSMFSIGRVIVIGMCTPFGMVHTTANATASSLTNLAIVVQTGIRIAMLTVIGRVVGARDIDQAKYYTKKLIGWCYVSQGLVFLLMLIFRVPLLSMYDNLSPETMDMAARLILLFCGAGIVLYPLSFVLLSSLRAANDGNVSLAISALSMLICRIGLSWLLCTQMGWGVMGVWVAMIIDWVSRATFFTWRYLSGKWIARSNLT